MLNQVDFTRSYKNKHVRRLAPVAIPVDRIRMCFFKTRQDRLTGVETLDEQELRLLRMVAEESMPHHYVLWHPVDGLILVKHRTFGEVLPVFGTKSLAESALASAPDKCVARHVSLEEMFKTVCDGSEPIWRHDQSADSVILSNDAYKEQLVEWMSEVNEIGKSGKNSEVRQEQVPAGCMLIVATLLTFSFSLCVVALVAAKTIGRG